MSSRYQERDREESRYSRDESDRKERPRESYKERDRDSHRGEVNDTRRRRYEDDAEADTYRSPRRDRERPKDVERARSRSPKRERDAVPTGPAAAGGGASRYDSGRERDDRRRGPNDDPNYRAPPREEYAPPGRGGFAGRGGGGGGRGFGGGRGGGGGGYGHGGRGGYNQGQGHGQGQGDYERPLDRRAIEEGRRRREEERAMGVMRDQNGGSGDASPYPEQEAGREGGAEGEEGEEEEVDPMASMMGFGGFGTTKGKSTGQYEGATSNVHKERTWRQYMNRRGGFNRPLDKLKK